MWVFLSDAFLSIVEPNHKAEKDKGLLLVRGRAKGDIERTFPGAKVSTTPNRDYRFRALIGRERVAQAIADEVRGLAYGNFKDSVDERDRHDAYLGVWREMNNFQMDRASPQKWKGYTQRGRGKNRTEDMF